MAIGLLSANQPNENLNGLLVEATGVFFEIFLIILVIDQLQGLRERLRWKTQHALLAKTSARAFVDLVRYNFVFTAPEAPDAIRATEFRDILRFSLTDLRSQIESFSASLPIEDQDQVRSIERSLNYVRRNFHSIESMQAKNVKEARQVIYYENYSFMLEHENWKCLKLIAETLDKYMEESSSKADREFREAVNCFLRDLDKEEQSKPLDVSNFYNSRWRLQDELSNKFSLPYVLLDRDERTSMAYAVLDIHLLKRIQP
ncbi:MAG: hypothetical protein AAF340_13820 [Pseudomonadota bacterium]